MSLLPCCAYHSGVEAVDQCGACRRDLCGLCQVLSLEGPRCRPCLIKEGSRRGRLGMLAAVGMLGGVALLGAFLLHISRSAAPPPKAKLAPVEVPNAATDDSREGTLQLARKASQSCDHKSIQQLVDLRSRQRRFEDSIAAAREFLGRCGEFHILQWRILDAQKNLARWAEARTTASALIAKDTYDSDYWWWRGEVEDHLKHPIAALADYRQSLSNSQDAHAGSFAAGRVFDTARAAERPCEGVFALELFAENLGGELRPQDEERILAVRRQAHCDALTSGPKSLLPKGTAARGLELTATLNGVKGRFLVNARVGTVAVSKEFASRANLTAAADAPIIETLILDELGRGPAVVVSSIAVESVTAKDVDALITEKLPEGIDGVLGLSFLWRFSLGDAGGRITLTRRL